MAWWALAKWFLPWCKSRRTNWVSWYKGYLYEQWFNSLSEEEQKNEIARIRKERELEKRRSEAAIRNFRQLARIIRDNCDREYFDMIKYL